jgi:integral membrane sensor domain MASE1/anti-sigma regulatory factor (Ser/Thr protein kinase)
MTDREGTPTFSGLAPLRPWPPPARHLGLLLLVGTAYYLGARFGLSLSLVESNVTPLWPPTGIALAAFLVFGRSMWPGVALAALAVNLPISEGSVAAAVTAVGNTAAPLVAAVLLGRLGFRRELDRLQDALALVFVAALASMLISANTGTAALVASGALPIEEFASAWAVWWTGDAMGVLAVAPFLLSLPLIREQPAWPLARWAEAVAILLVVAAVSVWATVSDLQVLFLTLPVLGCAAWRLELRGAAPAAMIATLIASGSPARGTGPFAHGTLFEEMLTLQAYNASVALTSFVFAALVSERARRQRELAETLQRSLLPDRLPDLPGIALAARYVPASADARVGGDWYDIVALPDGRVGLAIGDVAGHGLPAAATMGQLRMALRAYALQDPSPSSVMSGVHRLMSQLGLAEMVTLTYLVFDPVTRELRSTNAGHPPALLLADGQYSFLEDGMAPPVGVTASPRFPEAVHHLPAGATLVLYTDGLVERRGVSIQDGLDRLARESVASAADDVDRLCDDLLSRLVRRERAADDVALLAMRAVPLSSGPLELRLPAEPRNLVQVRTALRRWLRESEITADDENDILVASGEACANVVQHAYGVGSGEMEVRAALLNGSVQLTVRDRGQWRPAADRGGGWGLQLIDGLMDSVEVDHGAGGTEVRMCYRIGKGATS